MNAKLVRLSGLIHERNLIDNEISCLLGRPAQIAHAGEFIAAVVFDIRLLGNSAYQPVDGVFKSGLLNGKTVSVKWYGLQRGVLDISPNQFSDYYLVISGPETAPGCSGSGRPWTIENVYLFETASLIRRLKARGLPIGVASGLPREWWKDAELYPDPCSQLYKLNGAQVAMLNLFNERKGREDQRPNTLPAGGWDRPAL